MADDLSNRQIESTKLFFELFKHLTTLSAGSILIISALLERVFVSPKWPSFAMAGLIMFCISTLGAILGMMMMVVRVENQHWKLNKSDYIYVYGIVVAVAGFFGGVSFIVLFVWVNV